jgi:ribonucleoside-diphosphate reductase alpha chain
MLPTLAFLSLYQIYQKPVITTQNQRGKTMSSFKSNLNPMFRSKFSEDIFNHKYRHEGAETWDQLSQTLVEDVCGDLLSKEEKDTLTGYIRDMKFIPGGRYLYYAGRTNKFFNNCYLLRAEEDSREDWADLSWKAESCLMTGGGIGVDYSVYRPSGSPIKRTGGQASGPIPKMNMLNEIGRRVMQGGSRRSAIYASLNWQHGDVMEFLKAKDWQSMPVGKTGQTLWDIKQSDFNFPAPLDMTNISVNYDTDWLLNYYATGKVGTVFTENVKQALKTAEPGFSFNFFDKENETLRNACTEVTSADDSDVCNLGSVNMGRIEDINEMADVVELGTKFLLCGTMKAKLPYLKVYETREKNRRLGLGLMGMHEWLIKRGYRYEVTPELHAWLSVYKGVSEKHSKETADRFDVSRPVANRAIAPTGSIGILAGTSTGVEPIFAVAYKRRYLKGKDRWVYQYVVDSAAQELIDRYGAKPETVESALDLAADYERRMSFQADVQDYVDMSISSTINLPSWGSKLNNEDTVEGFAKTLAKYAPRLRGFTCYPDGARGGQPLTSVPYSEAVEKLGEEFDEHIETHDICDISGTGGSCGV